jgi:hypothetical protein
MADDYIPDESLHQAGRATEQVIASGGTFTAESGSTANIAGTFQIGGVTVAATAAQIDAAALTAGNVIDCTASTLAVTEATHNGRWITLNRAAGIAVTLPVAAAGLEFTFVVETTFTSAATIKSVASADIMIGYALMGNDSDNTIVRWPAIAGSTYDTIDMLGTGNSTGGLAGQIIRIKGLDTNLWFVEINGDAAGTEATPFANTVS